MFRLRRQLWVLLTLTLLLLLLLPLNAKKNPQKDKSSTISSSTSHEPAPTPSSTGVAGLPKSETRKSRKKTLKLENRLLTAKTLSGTLSQKRQRRIESSKVYKAKKIKTSEQGVISANKAAKLTPEQRQKAADKLKILKSLSAKSPQHIINLSYQQYMQFVVDQIRPYWLIVSYTALTTLNQCPLCHEIQRSMAPFANKNYESELANNDLTSVIDSEAVVRDKDYPIFFVNVDVARTENLFQQMKLTSAPTVVILSPKFNTKQAKISTILSSLPSKNKFTITSSRINLNDIIQFISKATGRSIIPDFNAITYEEITILVLVILVSAFCLYYFSEQLYELRNNRQIRLMLCAIGWCIYSWCISGGMYNIQKGSMFASIEKESGRINYINGDPRDQYGAEGLIIGGILITASILTVLSNRRAYDSFKLSGISKVWYENILISVSPLLNPWVCLIGIFFAWTQIVGIYTRKNPGYVFGLLWR